MAHQLKSQTPQPDHLGQRPTRSFPRDPQRQGQQVWARQKLLRQTKNERLLGLDASGRWSVIPCLFEDLLLLLLPQTLLVQLGSRRKIRQWRLLLLLLQIPRKRMIVNDQNHHLYLLRAKLPLGRQKQSEVVVSNHVLQSDLAEIIVTKVGRGTEVDVSEKETIVEEGINSLLERRRRPLPSPSLKGIGRNRKICFKHVMRN